MHQTFTNLIFSNAFHIIKSLLSHNPQPTTSTSTSKIENFLNKFSTTDDIEDSDEEEESPQSLPQPETKQEFEEKKRALTILLDQAVQTKMKVQKAFPEKLAKFGNVDRFQLQWHPGWREPERFVPELDCDPYRGACSQSSCPCEMFVTWPVEDGVYVYNPKLINPETELCMECYHPKIDHVLATRKDKSGLKEFSRENVEKYGVKYRPDLPKKHPSEVPLYELEKFYEKNPDYPGASPLTSKLAMMVEEEPKKTLADIDFVLDEEEELEI